MTLTRQIAKHSREVFTGGNWTAVNLNDTLQGITWQQATTKLHNLNSIAALVFHINYYIAAALRVLQGGTLDANDKFSFDLQLINSETGWQNLVTEIMSQADLFAEKVEQLDNEKLFEVFEDPKYGNYYRNLTGIIEHTHYHLGQIVLIKKIIHETEP
jgi:hypothetical protein